MTGSRGDKTERLLNLTLALLATRRPKTKNEIFAEIPGYSGGPDAMERMFERDKDELRALGINVEVLPIDAYFEDELGYQIIPRNNFLPEITLTFEESIWLSLATNVLSEISADENARQGLQKLLTFTKGPIDEVLEFTNVSKYQIPFNESLDVIWRAIKSSTSLQFIYSSPRKTQTRIASPIILTSRMGNWYLVALDLEDDVVKTFRVDRMFDISLDTQSQFRRPPESFNLNTFLDAFKGDIIEHAEILLHKDLSIDHPLVARAILKTALKTRDKLPAGEKIAFERIDRNLLLEMVLWAGDSVEILSPSNLRADIIERLDRIIQVNS